MTRPARLTLAEELALLALDDKTGKVLDLPAFALESAIAASVVMELSLEGRIDTDPDKLWVVLSRMTGDPLLDDALAKIVQEKEPQPAAYWLRRLADPALERRVIDRLVERGIVRSEEKRLLWVFKTRVYPPTSGIEEQEVRTRIPALLDSQDIPEAHDALLVGLMRSSGILRRLLTPADYERLRGRIDDIAQLEHVSRELSSTLTELQVALARTYVAG
jgi:hypothetical protein